MPCMRHLSRLSGIVPVFALAVGLAVTAAGAQSNFEIQVYGSDLVPVGATMYELHLNYTAQGSKISSGVVLATNHALHQTIEITHGFSEWFEVGTYLFLSERNGDGMRYVGNHIRPRFSIPARYKLPIGLSLSQEIGYNTVEFGPDTWTWEIRPIIDQRVGRFYWSINPVLGKALRGPSSASGFDFAPNVQVNLDVAKGVNVALEYYGAYGQVGKFATLRSTEQQIFPAVNLDFGDEWEFNAGVGFGLTNPTDHLLAKLIVGRRLGGKRK